MRFDRLRATRAGKTALRSIAACTEGDEDEAHWDGPNGELLEALQVAKAQRLEVADAPAPEMEAAAGAGVALREARVIAVHEGGMADRVALDFTTCADLGPRTPD